MREGCWWWLGAVGVFVSYLEVDVWQMSGTVGKEEDTISGRVGERRIQFRIDTGNVIGSSGKENRWDGNSNET